MSEVEGELAPALEVDDADLLEQATPVPADDDEEYPFAPESAGDDELHDGLDDELDAEQ